MTTKTWTQWSTEIHDCAFDYGGSAAGMLLSLSDEPRDLARSLSSKWDNQPLSFVWTMIPIPAMPHLPARMKVFDRSTLLDVHLEALLEGFLAQLELAAEE